MADFLLLLHELIRIHNIGFIQSHFWRNAGFGVIREIPHLLQYPGRYDPTVIPIENAPQVAESSISNTPPATETKPIGTKNYWTSADYHAKYRIGELTPNGVVEILLRNVRRDVDSPQSHSTAFLESQAELIREAAKASTERYVNNRPLGPLDGVPVAVKDEVHITGYKRTLGTKLDFKHGTDETSWCVKQWQEAGAIVIGKTTMHELGLGEYLQL